jgi:citrate lyase subunit beta/citryl-CoA lyase
MSVALDPSRPRRSVLYVPGSNARALSKAKELPADGLILDLEDAVAPAAKVEARERVREALQAGGFGRRECAIRVNALSTPWGLEDLRMVATSGADAVVIPKIERGEDIDDVRGLAAGLPVWPMIETPRAVLRLEEIAGWPGVAALVMGTSDLLMALHGAPAADRAPLLTSLSLCVLAARAHGLAALDGVHLDLEDAAGFEATCRQGRALGFDGRTLIHPKTIELANRVYGPTPEEIERSRRVIAAFREAEAEGRGVAVLDGRLVENLHVAEARRVLAMADYLALST